MNNTDQTDTAKTVTFRYRLYEFENGLGETFWRVKRQGFLGLYWWVRLQLRIPFNIDSDIRVWHWRANAVAWIEDDAKERRDKIAGEKKDKIRAKLKLIISEDITA